MSTVIRDEYMNRGSVTVNDDGGVEYRASAIGGCLTALTAGRLGYTETKPPKNLQKAYDRGHDAEKLVKNKMRDEGWVIWDEQARVELAVTGKIKVTGSIDGKVGQRVVVVQDQGSVSTITPYLGEIKSQNDEEWARFEEYGWEGGFFPKYKWQTSVYQLATGLPLCVIRCRVNKAGEIVDIKVEYREEPWYSLADIRRKLLTVEMMAAQMTIPSCDKPIFGCPFWYLPEHHADEDERVVVDDEDFEKIVVDYETSRAQAKLNKDKADKLRPTIDKLITERHGEGGQRLTTMSGVKVTRWSQNNPATIRWNEMIRDGVVTEEQVAEYTKQDTGWRLKVTLPKQKGE